MTKITKMYEKNKFWVFTLLMLLLIIGISATVTAATSVRVAVVIDIPGQQTITKCLAVDENSNAYDVLQKSGANVAWSQPGPSGHGICSVNGVGCPDSENCFCNSESTWYTYLKEADSSSWTDLLQTRYLDGGESCNEHYCAKEGNLLGFIYTTYGTKPASYLFNEICPLKSSQKTKDEYSYTLTPENPVIGDDVKIKIFDRNSNEGIRKVEVSFYYRDSKIDSTITNNAGEAKFSVNRTGTYSLKINVKGYSSPQKTITLSVGEKTEVTTTTTTETTTTTIKATTTTMPEATTTTKPTTTTSTSTTTTTEPKTTTTQPTTTTTVPQIDNSIIGQVTRFPAEHTTAAFILGLLVSGLIVVAAAYGEYKRRKVGGKQ